MAMTLLPRFFVLESGGRYLSVTENVTLGLPSGFLKVDEEAIRSPRVKFEVERAKTGDGQLVHIRSCYNNKYCEAEVLTNAFRLITASAEKPEEDRSKDSCTLFQVEPSPGNTGVVRLRFVQNQTFAGVLFPGASGPISGHFANSLTVTPSTATTEVFNVTNWETLAMPFLPRFFVLETGGIYLSVTENLSPSVPSGFVKVDGEQIWNPRVKFEVERAKTGDGELVHIRSCYNNKYWEALPGEFRLISASAEKPEEDRSKVSCTLFDVLPGPGGITGSLQLRFVQNGIYAGRVLPENINESSDVTIHDGVAAMSPSAQFWTITILNVINWETLVFLPTQVSFRSEELDGSYLCSRPLDTRLPYQRFESGMDVGDPVAAKELFPTPNGNYRIKDVHFGKFWRRSPNWIWADAEDNNNSLDTVFSIVKISDTVFALRSLGNNRFCGGLTAEGKTNCLNAQYPTITRQARLMIEERVLDRQISDIRYRLSDSRIYHEEIQEVTHAFATNDSPDNESTITLDYSISDSTTTHWTNSVSMSLGVSISFKVSAVPLIVSGEVEVSTELSYSREWGVSQTIERHRGASYSVVVPPLTSKKVTVMATQAACDVPFSYTQSDLLASGERVITTKDDGVYTGINSYNFYFQSSDVPKTAPGIYIF